MSTELMEQTDVNAERKAQLVAELNQLLADQVDSFVQMAGKVRELDRMAFDWSECDFPMPLVRRLRMISDGRLLPETFKALHSEPELLSIASRMSVSDQKRLASNENIRMAITGASGGTVELPALAVAENSKLRRQAFAADHIRSEAEQIAWVRGQETIDSRDHTLPAGFKVNKRLQAVIIEKPGIITRQQIGAILHELGE